MKVNIILLIIFIVLTIITFYIGVNTTILENFEDAKKEKDEIPTVKRPYVNLYDNFGNKLNVMLISKPFGSDSEYEIYKNNKDKIIFLGITSYLEFPGMVSNPLEDFKENYKKYKYQEITEGWIHGFRNPENTFNNNTPLLFASESDWTDCNVCKPDPNIKKEYDFIYICLKVDEKKEVCDDWATYNKNWTLAKKCLDIFCNKYKLKGLLVGRKGCKLPAGCKYLETTNMIKYHELTKMYNKSKFIFIPNEKDASPRVLTEALAMNIPCLVNRNILGGWKYINDQTGQFFTDENDISNSVDILLDNINNRKYSPRNYFIKHYSVINSGKKLKDFLYTHYGDRINIKKHSIDYISPEFVKSDFKPCGPVKEIHY
jgi:hypothetical protein